MMSGKDFCLACGASIPVREGEGTCRVCEPTGVKTHPPLYHDEHGDWAAANTGARYYALRDAVMMFAGDGIVSDDEVLRVATEQAQASNREPVVERLHRLKQAMENDANTFSVFDGNDVRRNIALAYAARVGQILTSETIPLEAGLDK